MKKKRFSLLYAGLALIDFLAVRRFADASGVVEHVENPDAQQNEPAWFEKTELGIDAAILTDKDKEYGSLNDYIKGSQHFRTLANSKGIVVPGEDATPEQQAAFKAELRKHIGDQMAPVVPESPDQYEIDILKNNTDLSDERKGEILSSFHQKGFSNEFASAAMEIYAAEMAKDIEYAEQMISAQRAQAEGELKQELGPEYENFMAGISRMEERYPDLVEAMKHSGVSGRLDYLKLMGEYAMATDEDGTGGGSMESRMENLDAQIKAVRQNPKFMRGDVFERRAMQQELEGLYKKKSALGSS